MIFQGCGTALVTPFQSDLSLDESALRLLVKRQVAAGIHFLVPCGTTGESPTLSRSEHLRVVEITMEEAAGRVPVVAGCGGYNTSEVIELARELEAMGVDALLSVTPYYNKPTQAGLYEHYRAIAVETKLPLIVYSVAGRTGVNLEPATLVKLAGIPNIKAVKEASGNVAQMASICARVPEEFAVLSGDDSLTLPLGALGGRGVISVASNQIPGAMSQMVNHMLSSDFRSARALHSRWLPLMEVNFVESNPIPVKYALSRMGLCQPVWRLPMTPPSAAAAQRVDAVLKELNLIP
jgi:4-hydroxy-tetrahydrodipicolinate synthase